MTRCYGGHHLEVEDKDLHLLGSLGSGFLESASAIIRILSFQHLTAVASRLFAQESIGPVARRALLSIRLDVTKLVRKLSGWWKQLGVSAFFFSRCSGL